jgi:tetratricopeptide (TPR) repeat protein
MMMLNEAQLTDLSVSNRRLEGLIHRLKGDIYGYGCLFGNALSEHIFARECFVAADLGYHAASTDYDIGTTYMLMRSYDEAEQSLLASLDYCLANGNRDFASIVLRELLTLAVYADKFDSGEEWLTYFEQYDIPITDQVHHYSMCAIMSAYRGRHAEAGELLARAVELGGESNGDVEYAYYLLARYRGDMRTALYWQERGKRRQDALVLESLEQPILNLEIELLHSTLDAERMARRLTRQRNTIISVSISLLLLVAIAYIRVRIRQKNQDIAQYVETIRELQLADRSISEQMNVSVSALYRDRFSELNHLCDIYYDHDGTARQKTLVFDRLRDTIEEIKHDSRRLGQLEEAVNLYRNNIYARMREQVTKLNDRDLRVALYVLAGFSNRAIAIFVDSDPSSVSKMRYNIKQKIKVAGAADGEEFCAAMSEK